MATKRLQWMAILLGGIAIAGLAGCNLFTDWHHDGIESDSRVLTADGNGALARGDYSNAVIYYQRALDHDPTDSEARVGLAQALVKRQKFNLVDFIKTISQNSNQTPGSQQLIRLSDWNCSTYAELIQVFSEIINALDPIVLGQTHGPYAWNNVTVNLDAGCIHVLRMAAYAQQISASMQVRQYEKGTPEAAALGIDPAVYNLLPNTFYWITNLPTAIDLTMLRTDINIGIACLRVAAANTSALKEINDLINMFSSLQTQLQ